MAKIRLRHVNSFYDRHGRLRHVCRIPGKPSFTLPGLPGGPQFMAAYHDALGDDADAGEGVGLKRTKPGTLNEAIVKYYQSEQFAHGLAEETQKMRRAILERFRATCGASGQSYGDKRIGHLREVDIKALMKPMTRDAQKNWLKAMRGLMAFALAADPPLIKVDPTKEIKVAKPLKKSMGFKTWLEPQVEQYRQHHALGTTARLAIELLLNIAARRYDAHVIGEQNVIISNKDGIKKLRWRPHKTLRSTGKMLTVKMLPSPQAALDAMPKPERGTEVALAFLTNDYGKPFASAAAFGNKFAG